MFSLSIGSSQISSARFQPNSSGSSLPINNVTIPMIKAMTEGKINIPTTLFAPQSATPPAIAPPMLCDVFQKPK